jgi:hypothetical protein
MVSELSPVFRERNPMTTRKEASGGSSIIEQTSVSLKAAAPTIVADAAQAAASPDIPPR